MVKDFLYFYIAASRCKIDEDERPTADSVNTFAGWFFAGFTRITGTLKLVLPEKGIIRNRLLWEILTTSLTCLVVRGKTIMAAWSLGVGAKPMEYWSERSDRRPCR
jgi:hypothetical protein